LQASPILPAMSDLEAPAKQQAIAARRGRERLIHALRSRVAVLAVGIFLLAFAGLFIQLSSGHDPGLSTAAAAAVTQSQASDKTTDGDATSGPDRELTDSAGQTDDQPATASDGESSSVGASAGTVVTRQS
jgi:hypothetical protein